MNYAALTEQELASLCRTDAGARQYVADNAEQILMDWTEMRDQWHQETWDEAHRDGQDVGSNMERDDLRDMFAERILDLHDRLAKARDDDKDLRRDCRVLLEELIDEYAMNK